MTKARTKAKPGMKNGTRDEIVWHPIEALKAYERNTRTHSPEQILELRASFREFGWVNPVLITSDMTIVAGHARVEAAKAEGWDTAKTMTVDGLTPAQVKAYVIADNRLALNAGWDETLLKLEFEDLAAAGFDTSLLGFAADEIDAILNPGTAEEEDEERVPPPPADPVSEEGDIWVLGNHRIICGSSTDPAAVAAVLKGAKPHLMVTDPPYGVKYDANWRNGALDESGVVRMKVGSGGRAIGQVLNDDVVDWTEAWALFPGDVAYVWHAPTYFPIVSTSLISVDFEIRSQIVWAKQHLVISRGHYHWQHELCAYAVRKGKTAHWWGDRKQTTVWEIDKPHKSETGHSTQKPLECMKRPIQNNSRKGDAVYEPFSGSGTTIIACEQLGRHCYAIELNPAYVDVAVLRWQEFTGLEATLEETGETFAQVKAGDIADGVRQP